MDDFRSIHEVVARRYRRLNDEWDMFPDLLLIDGGKGQLNAALAAFREQSIQPPDVLSLAKREEEIFLPGEAEPLRLSRHAYALRLLQYVRDEAHRFAQHYHHILRKKSTLGSLIERPTDSAAVAGDELGSRGTSIAGSVKRPRRPPGPSRPRADSWRRSRTGRVVEIDTQIRRAAHRDPRD